MQRSKSRQIVFDPDLYRYLYPDVVDLDDAEARAHWERAGQVEGRVADRASLLGLLEVEAVQFPAGFV
ncbi:MAG: hypothetical protein ACTH31_16585, partial [Pseudoclavibacter sp.]